MTITATEQSSRQTRSPRTRDKDVRQFLGMMRRMIRAAGRRIELEDPTELQQLVAMHAELDEVIARTAKSLHDNGFSWGEIGRQMGMTRQAAQQRWGK